jgi:hypothetical protein
MSEGFTATERAVEQSVRCPTCDAGPGRQDPQYRDGAQTGWFECEVDGTRYVISRGKLWIPAEGTRVKFHDRSQDCEGVIVRVGVAENSELVDIQEYGPDGMLLPSVFRRYATVVTPVAEP